MRLGLGLIFILMCLTLASQNDFVVVDSIKIVGNKKTKGPIIFRELIFQAGDTILLAGFNDALTQSKQNLMNTSLFSQVETKILDWDSNNKVKIQIVVNEAWFFFPAPIFELADRNFNVWWVDQKRALDRINLGFRLKYLNMSGHRDELNTVFHTGYTQKYELEYSFPYLNREKTIGITSNILFRRNKEIHYNNDQNKQVFHNEGDLDLFKRFRIKAGIFYRPNFYFTHYLAYEFHRNNIDPFVIQELNPRYFGNQETSQRFHLIEYIFEADRRDLNLYPLNGYFFRGRIRKVGFGSDSQKHVTLRVKFQKTFPILKQSGLTNQSILQTVFESKPLSFNLRKAHGYGDDYLRGYELYVINGESFFLNKTKGKWNIWSRTIDWKKWMPIKVLKIMPASIYLTTNFDFGYVRNSIVEINSPLSNRWIYGYGIGLDVILYNNYAYTMEYSINQLNEKGIYLHFNVGL